MEVSFQNRTHIMLRSHWQIHWAWIHCKWWTNIFNTIFDSVDTIDSFGFQCTGIYFLYQAGNNWKNFLRVGPSAHLSDFVVLRYFMVSWFFEVRTLLLSLKGTIPSKNILFGNSNCSKNLPKGTLLGWFFAASLSGPPNTRSRRCGIFKSRILEVTLAKFPFFFDDGSCTSLSESESLELSWTKHKNFHFPAEFYEKYQHNI